MTGVLLAAPLHLPIAGRANVFAQYRLPLGTPTRNRLDCRFGWHIAMNTGVNWN